MRLCVILGAGLTLIAGTVRSQTDGAAFTWIASGAETEQRDDPGYQAYREGYRNILNEEWDAAREAFAALVARHPESTYADDAKYWSAYAMMHRNRAEAVKEYRRFLKEHARSSYYDDAVADLAQLRVDAFTPPPDEAPAPPAAGAGSVPVLTGMPQMRQAEREFRRASRALGRLRIYPRSGVVISVGSPGEQAPDDETVLRIEAIQALGDTQEDEKSFQMLKDIALDMKQPPPVREVALDALAGFRTHDALSVCVEVATKDTSPEFQTYAIDVLGRSGDSNRSMSLLMQVYRTLPPSRKEQRENVVYTIAETGGDRAVDFLMDVALTGDDYGLRRDAVYYLGTIGGERARSALYEILKGR